MIFFQHMRVKLKRFILGDYSLAHWIFYLILDFKDWNRIISHNFFVHSFFIIFHFSFIWVIHVNKFRIKKLWSDITLRWRFIFFESSTGAKHILDDIIWLSRTVIVVVVVIVCIFILWKHFTSFNLIKLSCKWNLTWWKSSALKRFTHFFDLIFHSRLRKFSIHFVPVVKNLVILALFQWILFHSFITMFWWRIWNDFPLSIIKSW